MVRLLGLLLLIGLAGCVSSGNVYEVQPRPDPDVHVIGYDITPRFTGYELTFGIPALAPVPIIGPYLAEAIRFRFGKNDIVITPRLTEDMYKLRKFRNEVPPASNRRPTPPHRPRRVPKHPTGS
jgi:hypothetical protein